MDISLFWGVTDVIETRPCTCSARGCLNTNDASAVDICQRQNTLSQCPWCIWMYDNQNAREWLQVTEVDREQVGLMVSLIALCLVHAVVFSCSSCFLFFSRVPSFSFIRIVPSGQYNSTSHALSNFLHRACQATPYVPFAHSRPL